MTASAQKANPIRAAGIAIIGLGAICLTVNVVKWVYNWLEDSEKAERAWEDARRDIDETNRERLALWQRHLDTLRELGRLGDQASARKAIEEARHPPEIKPLGPYTGPHAFHADPMLTMLGAGAVIGGLIVFALGDLLTKLVT